MACLCQDALDPSIAMTIHCAALHESLAVMAKGDIFGEVCKVQGCVTFLAEWLQTVEVKLATVVAEKDCLQQHLFDLATKDCVKEDKLHGEVQDCKLWPCEDKNCECAGCTEDLEGKLEDQQREMEELKEQLA